MIIPTTTRTMARVLDQVPDLIGSDQACYNALRSAGFFDREIVAGHREARLLAFRRRIREIDRLYPTQWRVRYGA